MDFGSNAGTLLVSNAILQNCYVLSIAHLLPFLHKTDADLKLNSENILMRIYSPEYVRETKLTSFYEHAKVSR